MDALIALANIHKYDRPTAKECRAYHCPTCAGYHLTSDERRQQR